MFKSTFFALFTLVTYIAAQQAAPIVSITSPLTKQSYTAGGQAIITWINPKVDTIPSITLSKGPSTALQPVAEVAKNVNAKDQKYTWTIPANTPPGDDYAFVLGVSPDQAYTGQFSIKASDGSQPPASPSNGSGSPSGSSSSGSSPSSPSSSGTKPNSPSNSPSAGNKVSPLALSVMIVVGVAMSLF
ncbi:unnamed protein product [Cunninghamella echinulata]